MHPIKRIGSVPPTRSIASLFMFVLIAAFYGCASLPNVQDKLSHELSGDDEPTKILGPKGELPSKKSDAMIRRLENQVDPTELLEQQVQLMQSISGSPLTAGNKATLLIDGPATYAAMFAAIENAKDNINFQTFIFEDDEIGKQFSDLLLRKSAGGVQVNLIYDSFGSLNTPAAFFQHLREGGVNVLEFNPLAPGRVPAGKKWEVSNRDHRKILVVDGAVAFTGGVNISGVYSGSSAILSRGGNHEEPWRDTHVRIEGPVTAEFQRFFLKTWERQKGPPLPKRDYFPSLKQAGNTLVQVVGSLPGEKNRRIFTMYLSAITHAQNSIYLTTPYFVPDEQMLRALTEAARRGVDVKIVLPSRSDSALVYYASRHHYRELLQAGVQLFERRGGMLHAKTAVIDNVWSTIGSNNLDTLSFLTNDEANAVILGKDFADSMQAMFERDLKESDQIMPEGWEKRSVRDRFKEWGASLFKHWL
ncbi:MAG: cardiolipin synthase [Desulfovibrionaceae bacterium]|nr:cardiolipin synthase [Desulfovibrionaceae bacterium]MBF0515270.1 cardiolipin synthase [Desulfovibrionaceae bacterium]